MIPISTAYPNLTDAECSADARTLRRALEEARRDADAFAFTISDIVKALDDAGFQQRELPPLERVKEVIKMNDAVIATNSRYIERIGALEDELELIKEKAQEQSEAVQRDWLSPCEVEGLRRKVAEECAKLAEIDKSEIVLTPFGSVANATADRIAAAIRERFGIDQ